MKHQNETHTPLAELPRTYQPLPPSRLIRLQANFAVDFASLNYPKSRCRSKVVGVSTMAQWECGGGVTAKFHALETLTLDGSEG